jgi:hypothetical protein
MGGGVWGGGVGGGGLWWGGRALLRSSEQHEGKKFLQSV